MNVPGKFLINDLRLVIYKQFRRRTCKIAVEIDQNVKRKIETEELKPRRHPGIVKFDRVEMPARIQKALERIVGDYPIKALMEDCKKLNNFIASRHPPAEAEEINAKIRKITEEIDSLRPPEKQSEHGEDGQLKAEKRKEELIRKRMRERIFTWKPVKYGHYESVVYAIGRGSLEYGVLMRIIHEIKLRDENFKPQSYLDFGSGIGTGMWAVSSVWKDSIYEYFNIDSSREMNEMSELILRDGNDNQQMTLKNVFYRQFLPGLETKYDMVVSAYSLFELSNFESRKEVILNLWKKCDGYLIIVEEGSRRGSELINEARNLILSQEKHDLIGHVFAPCPHDNICPRLSNPEDRTPCNFEINYTPTKIGGTSLKNTTTRFSYVVLKKGIPTDSSRTWPRLVRPTLVRSKHSICRMCTSEGNLQEIIFTQSKHGREAYRCARASRWGDRLPITIGEPIDTMKK